MSAADILTRIDADLIEPQRLAQAVLDQLQIERRTDPTAGRLTAREALQALYYEAFFVCITAHSLANGIVLRTVDLERLLLAWARIEAIIAAVH